MQENPKQAQDKVDNPIDVWAAVKSMKDSKGWQFLMERYGKEGDALLTDILNVETPENKRALLVYELRALGRLAKVLNEIEMEAKAADKAASKPKHVGV